MKGLGALKGRSACGIGYQGPTLFSSKAVGVGHGIRENVPKDLSQFLPVLVPYLRQNLLRGLGHDVLRRVALNEPSPAAG